jgi:hypothetical protein
MNGKDNQIGINKEGFEDDCNNGASAPTSDLAASLRYCHFGHLATETYDSVLAN